MEAAGYEPALRSREAQPEQRPAAGRLLRGDGAAVRLGHLSHNCEPETRAGKGPRVRRAIEPVEDVLAVLRRDPRAVIADTNFAACEGDLDRRPRRAPLPGVLEQVPDGTLEPFRNALDDRRLELCLER